MSDRTEQAQAEAKRRLADFYDTWGHAGTIEEVEWEKGFHSGFGGGVEWADANHPAVEALARVRELHRPVHPVFNWQTGLRYEDPCETCWGKAGVHECGCWAEEDTEYECRECSVPGSGAKHVLWPCATWKATEAET